MGFVRINFKVQSHLQNSSKWHKFTALNTALILNLHFYAILLNKNRNKKGQFHMEISVSSNTVVITGNIKTISDYQQIKENVDNLTKNHQHIIITIQDSISITSSVIGYLNKLVLKENIDVEIKVGNAQLIELFEDLNLVSLFKVKKV